MNETQRHELQTYAWAWFALHAGQRLQMVNFWLIATAFLAGAYVQAIAEGLKFVAFGLSVAGCITSGAFVILDIRTRQLVLIAEDALKHLEQMRTSLGAEDIVRLTYRSHTCRSSSLQSYRVVIQGLELCVAVLFACGSIYTLV